MGRSFYELRKNRDCLTIRVVVGYKGETPVRRSERVPLGTSKQDLVKLALRLKDEYRNWLPPEPKTLYQVACEWLDTITVSPRTMRDYRLEVNAYLKLEKHIDKVTLPDLEALIEGRGARTQKKIKGRLNRVFKYGMVRGYVTSNIVTGLTTKPYSREIEIRVLTQNELRGVLDLAEKSEFHTLFRLLAVSGLRIGEALVLTSQDVLFQNDWSAVRVSKSLDDLYNPASVGKPKSRYARRTVEIPKPVAKQVKAAMPHEWVYRDALQAFADIKKQVGIDLRIHDLRHTHCCHLLLHDVNPVVVSRRMGHHSVAFTLSTYAHLLPEMSAGLGKVLENIV